MSDWKKPPEDWLKGQPVTRLARDLVKNDKCPKCRGSLDMGWECTFCGYDAGWLACLSLRALEGG